MLSHGSPAGDGIDRGWTCSRAGSHTGRVHAVARLQPQPGAGRPTFTAAADEAGISRRYGGIHFSQGDLEGRSLGRVVGLQVWLEAQTCFIGVCL